MRSAAGKSKREVRGVIVFFSFSEAENISVRYGSLQQTGQEPDP